MTDTLSDESGGIPPAGSGSEGPGLLEVRPSTRLIDLTLTLRPGMRGVAFEPKCNFKGQGWNAQTLHLYSHCGTHMDAPIHSEAGDQTIDEVPLAQCMGPAWLVKLDGIAPKALITVADLGDITNRFAPGDSLLVRTGWSAFVDQAKWRDELPRISLELARWCVDKRVKLVGVEPPSVADVNNLPEVIQIHQTLLGGGVLIVEGLTNLEAITQEKIFFAALPLKPLRGDGSPVRAFVVEGDGSAAFQLPTLVGANLQPPRMDTVASTLSKSNQGGSKTATPGKAPFQAPPDTTSSVGGSKAAPLS
ncbi:MAG: cyclase family protein [Verrucomicrobiia bacterium]